MRQLLLERGLGGGASSGGVSCVRRACLGKCSREPLAHLAPDDIWYRALSAQSLLRIYEHHLSSRQPVLDLVLTEREG